MLNFMLNFLRFIQGLASPALDLFLTVLNMLSQQYFLVLLVSVIYWTVNKKRGEQLAYSLIFTICFSCGLKGVFKIPRPYNYEGIRVVNKSTAPGWSFPSADSSAAASVAATLCSWTRKPIYWGLLAFYMLVIGFCRMYFGLHFPTDVIGGFSIGIIIALSINKLLSTVKDTFKLYLISGLILLPFIFFGQEPDYFKTLGLMLGAISGIAVEHKFVNFSCDIPLSKKGLRLLLGLVGLIAIALLCSAYMPEENIFYVFEKFLLTFFAVGIYPFIFTKFGF